MNEFTKNIYEKMQQSIPEVVDDILIKNITKITGVPMPEAASLVKDKKGPFTVHDLMALCFLFETTPNELLGFDITYIWNSDNTNNN